MSQTTRTRSSRHIASVWTLILLSSLARVDSMSQTDYYGLVDSLMTNYKKEVRPVHDDSYNNYIYISFTLLSILEMNEQNQMLVTNAILKVMWQDEFLTWERDEDDVVDYIMIRQKRLWLPDIVLANSVSSQDELGHQDLNLRVNYQGFVWWSPSAIFTTSCHIDITYFPFDTQVCSVVFKTSISDTIEIMIKIDEDLPLDTTHYTENGLWDLLNISAKNVDKEKYDYESRIEIKLELQRRRSFYVLNIILPIIFLSLTSPLVFALPSDSGEKMSLSITVLVAYTIYLTIVMDTMPSTSMQLSVLTLYLLFLLFVNSVGVVLSTWIVRLHHRPSCRPVGGALARATLVLRKAFRMPVDNLDMGSKFEKGRQLSQQTRSEKDDDLEIIFLDAEKLNGKDNEETGRDNRKGAIITAGNENESVSTIKRSIPVIAQKSKVPEIEVAGSTVAETIDRLLFIIFVVITFASTLIAMAILLIGSSEQKKNITLQ